MGPCRSTCMWIGMQTTMAYLRLWYCQSRSMLHQSDFLCLDNANKMEFAVNRADSTTAGKRMFPFYPTRAGDHFCKGLVISQKQKQSEAAHNCPTVLIIELAPVKDFWRQPLTRGIKPRWRVSTRTISELWQHFLCGLLMWLRHMCVESRSAIGDLHKLVSRFQWSMNESSRSSAIFPLRLKGPIGT